MLKQIDFTMNTGLKYHMFFDDEHMTEAQALVECEFVGWGAGHDYSLYPYYLIVPEGKEPILSAIKEYLIDEGYDMATEQHLEENYK